MAGDERDQRRRPTRQFLPPIGFDVPEWLQNFLTAAKTRLEALYIDPDPPGQPANMTATTVTAGIILRWAPAEKAIRYQIWRGTTSEFQDATLIQVLYRNDNVSYLDVAEQVPASTLYYWVRAESAGGSDGPLSRMQSATNPNFPGGGALDLPFGGSILGSGRHGSLHITGNTTATYEVPIYELTDLTIDAGVTWTAYNSQPGGFIIAVTGTCTIAGTIDADGRGAKGGPAVSGATTPGYNGEAGMALAGGGGGGGASSGSAAGNEGGGHGGPTKAREILSGYNAGGFLRTADTNSFFTPITAPTTNELILATRGTSTLYLTGSGAGGYAAGVAGGAGTPMSTNIHNDPFGLVWSLQRATAFGWGGGGGSGGCNFGGAGSSGVGGNGGGLILILCATLNFTGSIVARGIAGTAGSATAGAGGGGGGGCVLIGYRTLVANSGTITVTGGAGGTGGGGGGNGGAGGTGYSKVYDFRQ